MSENENQPPLPSKQTSSVPTPSKQTSSVPLKKETVRVTLKAADAPPSVPSATVPVRPPVPGGPPPAPTAPGAATRRPAPAPTIPLRTAGAPTAPGAAAPAPTIRLATSTAPIGAATAPAKTAGGTPTLPKATVQLQAPTQPIGTSIPSSPSQVGTLQMDDDDDEVDANDGIVKVLAGVGFAAALALLAFQVMLAKTWITVDDNPRTGDWSQLIE